MSGFEVIERGLLKTKSLKRVQSETKGSLSKDVSKHARQPEKDLFHSWAVVFPKFWPNRL